MRTPLLLPTLAILATALCASPARSAPRPAERARAPGDLHGRIDRVLAAYGGRAALARLRAYRLEGELYSPMRDERAPLVRVFERPGRFKTLIHYEEGPEARVVGARGGWHADHGGNLVPANPPMLAAMKLQAARADLPWVLAEHESVAVAEDPMELDGVKLDGIRIPLGEGLTLLVYIDPLTHLARVSRGAMDAGGMQTYFETRYADFRSVRGVRFPFHEENFASGMAAGVTTVDKVEPNPPLDPGEFEPGSAADSTGSEGRSGGS